MTFRSEPPLKPLPIQRAKAFIEAINRVCETYKITIVHGWEGPQIEATDPGEPVARFDPQYMISPDDPDLEGAMAEEVKKRHTEMAISSDLLRWLAGQKRPLSGPNP